jgi:CRP/FNR family transcriptional regulator, nitrogen fixation regulation protein
VKGHDGANECDPLAKSMHLMGAIMSSPRNMEILGEDEPADYVYKVTSGSVRTYKILSDGHSSAAEFFH